MKSRSRARSSHVIVAVGCFLVAAPAAFTQVITGTIFGTVRDATGGVLPGASVTVSSPALPSGPATFVTNEKGQYRFPNLAPGAYRLAISLPGFGEHVEENLRVEVGGNVERRVVLTPQFMESVTVVNETPTVDTMKTGLSTNYGNEFVANTPLIRFSMFDLLKSAPGMSESNELGSGVSAFGSSNDENTFLLDGTDFTAPISGNAWPWPDPDVIEEIEIVSLGASAEYGNMAGAVFNVVTKQGTNSFRFDAAYYGMFDALTSKPTLLECDCPDGETGFVSTTIGTPRSTSAGPS